MPKERQPPPTNLSQARKTAEAILADLKRQAKASSVISKTTGPKQLSLIVRDHDDWLAFMVGVLRAAQDLWWAQGDRADRAEKGEPSLPTFKTVDDWHKAIKRVATSYWVARGIPAVRLAAPMSA